MPCSIVQKLVCENSSILSEVKIYNRIVMFKIECVHRKKFSVWENYSVSAESWSCNDHVRLVWILLGSLLQRGKTEQLFIIKWLMQLSSLAIIIISVIIYLKSGQRQYEHHLVHWGRIITNVLQLWNTTWMVSRE